MPEQYESPSSPQADINHTVPPMIFDKDSRVRVTNSELNFLRQRNAHHGNIITRIATVDELLNAVIGGLPSEIAADLLEYLETGRSPMTSPQQRQEP